MGFGVKVKVCILFQLVRVVVKRERLEDWGDWRVKLVR